MPVWKHLRRGRAFVGRLQRPSRENSALRTLYSAFEGPSPPSLTKKFPHPQREKWWENVRNRPFFAGACRTSRETGSHRIKRRGWRNQRFGLATRREEGA